MQSSYEHRPNTDPNRVYAAHSRAWDRDQYAKTYGKAAMVEADACRSAVRNGDVNALWEAQRRLSFVLYRDCKWLFGVGG